MLCCNEFIIIICSLYLPFITAPGKDTLANPEILSKWIGYVGDLARLSWIWLGAGEAVWKPGESFCLAELN